MGLTTAEWAGIVTAASTTILLLVVAYALLTTKKPSTGEGAGILRRLRNEPALLAGVVGSGTALLATFGLELSAEQTGAILAVLSAVLAVIVRQRVSPV